jgi:hypothetical protein
MTFTVTKTALYDRAISVQYATANVTATAGPDYVATSGTLNFLPAEMSKTITVVVNTDVYGEPVETFSVNLFSAVSATITDATGTGTITDDDVYPGIVITGADMYEGSSGTQVMNFQVTLDVVSNQPITVYYQCNPGTASYGEDFGCSGNSVTIQPGQTSTVISIYIIGDLYYENNESFTVSLTSASGGHIVTGQATGTIYNDDQQPSITIMDASSPEGSAANPYSLSFTVQISETSGLPISVNYNVSSGTAIVGQDLYYTSGTLTFPAGWPPNFTKTITVYIIGDSVPEPNETFFLNLTNPVNVGIAGGTATGTIYNDD